jgi:hypothetical protein
MAFSAILALAALAALLSACVPAARVRKSDPPGVVLYAAGYELDTVTDKPVAVVWKLTNGVVQTIPLTDGSRNAYAQALAESGGVLYAAGSEMIGIRNNENVARVWKLADGAVEAITLADERRNAFAYALAESGGRLYAGGNGFSASHRAVATVWRLTAGAAEIIPLTDGTRYAFVYALTESAGRLCAAGNEFSGTYDGIVVTIWRLTDGAVETIPLTGGTRYARTRALVDSGGSLYAAGSEWDRDENAVATVWKLTDGVVQSIPLTDGTWFASADALAGSGAGLYAAGFEYSAGDSRIATVWKLTNDVVTETVSLTDGSRDAIAHALLVSGNSGRKIDD